MTQLAVRRESVRLELEDHFSTGMVKAAAATALLDKSLDHLSGSSVKAEKSTRSSSREVDGLTRSSRDADQSINQLTGRLSLLADATAVLGPSLVPIAAVGVPAVSGLASAFGFAAIGAGTALVAFQGVGDALKAVNKAELQPTTANLNAARTALEGLSPAAADFVQQIQNMMPGLKALRDTAAEGLFPGVTAGLDALEGAFPRVQRIFEAISTELGNIAQETGESLASDRWAPFLDFIATEGPSALGQLADAVGNTAHAFAGLWMSTTPLNQDFLGWLVQATADLDEWSNKLGSTDGFKEFVSYIEQTGPQVAETFGAIANAAVQILQAVAPLGGPVLQGIEGLAKILGTIADSDLGTPIFGAVAALALLNRSLALSDSLSKATWGGPAIGRIRGFGAALTTVTTAQDRARLSAAALARVEKERSAAVRSGLVAAGKGAALAGVVALASTDAADKIGLQNTATLALAGSLAGPYGIAIGGAVGLLKDFSNQLSVTGSAFDSYRDRVLAAAGPDVGAQISAVTAEIAKQKAIVNGERFTVDLGFTTLHSDDGAARAAEKAKGLKGTLKSLQAQQEATDKAARIAGGGYDQFGNKLTGAAKKADDLRQAIVRAQNVLSGRGTEVEYAASIDAMSKALRENGKTLDITTEKGRANRTALDAIASGALNLADKIQDPKLKSDFLDNARTQFVRSAKAAGATSEEARKLATQVGLLNTVKGTARVNVDGITESFAGIDALKRQIASLRDRNIKITVTRSTNATTAEQATGNADGGSVPKTGLPYADRHLYMLADGEEVISNRHGQADRNRGLLKAINDNKLAGGGTVNPYGTVDISHVGSGKKPSKRRKGKSRARLTSSELHDATVSLMQSLASSLGLAASGPAAEVRAAFNSFAKQIRQDGGTVGKGFGALRDELTRSAKAIDKSRDAIEKEKAVRDGLIADRKQLSDTIQAGLTRDIFTTDRTEISPWLSNAERQKMVAKDLGQTPLDKLRANIRDGKAFIAAEKTLKSKGLNGDAFEALVSTGNLAQVREFAGKSKKELAEYERLYDLSQKTTRRAGDLGGEIRYGTAIAKAQAELAALRSDLKSELGDVRKALKELGPDIGKTINKAAAPPKRGG